MNMVTINNCLSGYFNKYQWGTLLMLIACCNVDKFNIFVSHNQSGHNRRVCNDELVTRPTWIHTLRTWRVSPSCVCSGCECGAQTGWSRSCHRTDTCSGSLHNTHKSIRSCHRTDTCSGPLPDTHKSIRSCHRTDTCSGPLPDTHKSIGSCHWMDTCSGSLHNTHKSIG